MNPPVLHLLQKMSLWEQANGYRTVRPVTVSYSELKVIYHQIKFLMPFISFSFLNFCLGTKSEQRKGFFGENRRSSWAQGTRDHLNLRCTCWLPFFMIHEIVWLLPSLCIQFMLRSYVHQVHMENNNNNNNNK